MNMISEKIGRAEIRWLGIPLPEFTKATRPAIVAAGRELLFWWRENMAAEHFTTAAYSRYGGREDRVFDHRRDFKKRGARAPLVSPRMRNRDYRGGGYHYAGELRRAFLRGAMKVDVTGQRSGNLKIRAVWGGLPRQAYQDTFGPNQSPGPKMYKELTIVTEAEQQVLAAKFSELFDHHLGLLSTGGVVPSGGS